ncbi:MAG TPA: ROK family protein [Acidimicrobiales bacterium]
MRGTSGLVAGIDIGGTKCLGVVIDADGEVVREARRATPKGPDAVVEVLADLAEELQPWDAVGIGAAGLVTLDGVVRAAPNLPGVFGLALRARLEVRLGRPVAVDNDATCAMLAEWRLGAAQGAADAVLVTLGTGIGGGLVVDGSLVRGRNGFAGEPGHMVVDPNGPWCVCGRHGCWERYASGSGLGALARSAATAGRLERVVDLAGDAEAVRGEHVQQAALEGDTSALEVLDEFGRWVAIGLVNLTNLLDPEVLVVGGGLAEAGDLLLDPVRRWVAELLYAPQWRPHPRVELAVMGERAGAVGAAMVANGGPAL